MHPILGNIRRLSLYLLAWIPLTVLTAFLLTIPRGISLAEAAALAFPLCLLYAFVCLSAWYPCRVSPIERSGVDRILWIHVSAAIVAALLWVLASWVVAWVLSANFLALRSLNERLDPELPLIFGMGILFYLLTVAFFYVLIAVEASKEAEARVMRASVLAREAELRALKAQVNPHFLFNSLNSISALTTSDAPKAREMCILLGDFLRRTLGLGEKTSIPLEEEMSLIHAFLAVEKIRYGARMQMEEKIDQEALDAQVPPLLLQPLVENAVGHGIANLVEGGWIKLAAERRDGELSIVVENLFDPEAPPRRKSGVGLANVRQRLAARYGNRANFATSVDGPCFRVAITLPAESKERVS
jgi:two-component system, LytTR family, sensor histidine kinase AlgZ